MTQRIRGITDEEAVGPAKNLFDASNKMLGRSRLKMTIKVQKKAGSSKWTRSVKRGGH